MDAHMAACRSEIVAKVAPGSSVLMFSNLLQTRFASEVGGLPSLLALKEKMTVRSHPYPCA